MTEVLTGVRPEQERRAPVRRVNRLILPVLRPLVSDDRLRLLEYLAGRDDIDSPTAISKTVGIPQPSFFKYAAEFADANLISTNAVSVAHEHKGQVQGQYAITPLGRDVLNLLIRINQPVGQPPSEQEVEEKIIPELLLKMQNHNLKISEQEQILEIMRRKKRVDRRLLPVLSLLITREEWIAITEELAVAGQSLTIEKIAMITSKPKSYLFRNLKELEQAKFIEHQRRGEYSLTPGGRGIIEGIIDFGEKYAPSLVELQVMKLENNGISDEQLDQIRSILIGPYRRQEEPEQLLPSQEI